MIYNIHFGAQNDSYPKGVIMLVTVLKSKIHMATVTEAELLYEGSITVDADLIKEVGLIPGELVHVLNFDNGERFETYIIEGSAGSGIIGLRGPAARKGKIRDRIIIASYAMMDEDDAKKFKSKVILLDEKNRIKKKK